MKTFGKLIAVLYFVFAMMGDIHEAPAADVEVRLNDGRTLRGSVIENQTSKEQLALELRSSGITIRRTLSWKQVADLKIVPPIKIKIVAAEVPQLDAKPAAWPLFELQVRAEPVSTFGKMNWDSLRLSLRGFDQRGQPVPLFGTLRATLWGLRVEPGRLAQNRYGEQNNAAPRGLEQLDRWTRQLDSETERIAGTAVPVGARQGRSGTHYEDVVSYPWSANGLEAVGVNGFLGQNVVGRQGRGRAFYQDNPDDIVQLILPFSQPTPDQNSRTSPFGEVSVELLMPGVGVFSATSGSVVLSRQSPLRQYILDRDGTRFFPNESTTGSTEPFGNRALWPERRVLTVEP